VVCAGTALFWHLMKESDRDQIMHPLKHIGQEIIGAGEMSAIPSGAMRVVGAETEKNNECF
jgi:hypothetical protein